VVIGTNGGVVAWELDPQGAEAAQGEDVIMLVVHTRKSHRVKESRVCEESAFPTSSKL